MHHDIKNKVCLILSSRLLHFFFSFLFFFNCYKSLFVDLILCSIYVQFLYTGKIVCNTNKNKTKSPKEFISSSIKWSSWFKRQMFYHYSSYYLKLHIPILSVKTSICDFNLVPGQKKSITFWMHLVWMTGVNRGLNCRCMICQASYVNQKTYIWIQLFFLVS